MIGSNLQRLDWWINEGFSVFHNIIPVSGGNGCEVCGMARTLGLVTNPDDPFCQTKQLVMVLERKQETFKAQELRDR